jgi:CTP synthase
VLVEVVELAEHPFYVASQFHPEFKSRPERPAPLFREFVAAALAHTPAERELRVKDARASAAARGHDAPDAQAGEAAPAGEAAGRP